MRYVFTFVLHQGTGTCLFKCINICSFFFFFFCLNIDGVGGVGGGSESVWFMGWCVFS
jgi:hypothetical protein